MMITAIDDYFTKGCGRCERFATPDCSTRAWIAGLEQLRRICLDCGLTETVKWGHPCYMHAGRNIVIIGAFRNDYRITFFNASLMRDPEGVLERQGPNSRHPDMIRFVKNDDVARMAPVIQAYLREAMNYAETGLRGEKEDVPLDLPEELVTAMDDDPVLAEAFHRLTPGRQKSYVILLNGAKQTDTRRARILKNRDKILAGKGALER
ncbi:YdeI/OmpD-associated family protein [Rhizobium sp. CAU 1783]